MKLFCILGFLPLLTTAMSVPVVKIPQGTLQGKNMISRDQRIYSGFMGIPYANKPQRFEVATFASGWQGLRKASKFGPICPQFNLINNAIEGDEDCLSVNVFTPQIDGSLAVMVFIHGGGFQFGNSGENGADYFMDEDVVYVSLNYRLAALGFLSTGDSVLPGNLGLKDQNLALRWVQHNIKYFGGDPNKITLFGESAGAAAVSYHLLSPLSKGLFRYAICQSGSALDPWAFTEKPKDIAVQLAKNLGCPFDTSENIKTCLLTKPRDDILQQTMMSSPLDVVTVYVPTKEPVGDSAFLTETPEILFREGKFHKVPMMITANDDEGLLTTATLIKDQNLRQSLDENWDDMIPRMLYFDDQSTDNKAHVAKLIRNFYLNDQRISDINMQNLTNLFSDRTFIHGSRKHAMQLARYSPVHISILAYKGIWSQIFGMGFTEVLGMSHADDLQYIFNYIKYPRFKRGSEQEIVSKIAVKTWVNFANTGDPNFSWEGIKWDPLTADEIKTKVINWIYLKKFPEKLHRPLQLRMEFWDFIEFFLTKQRYSKDEL